MIDLHFHFMHLLCKNTDIRALSIFAGVEGTVLQCVLPVDGSIVFVFELSGGGSRGRYRVSAVHREHSQATEPWDHSQNNKHSPTT